VNGTATFGSRMGGGRAEAFELKSRDEGEFGERMEGQPREGNTFWVRSDSDEESRESGEDVKGRGNGGIRKTVRVSVQEGVRADAREEREKERIGSIMVKLDV